MPYHGVISPFGTMLIAVCLGIGMMSLPSSAKQKKKVDDSWGRGVYRGANVSSARLNVDDYRVLRSWGADHIRYQLAKYNAPTTEKDGEVTFSDATWQSVDTAIDQARQAGLKVLIDLHQGGTFFPVVGDGWWKPANIVSWVDPKCKQRLISFWQNVARHYVNERGTIIGYDILNEPGPPKNAEGAAAWNAIVVDVVKAIREIDTYHTIVIEPAYFGGPDGLAYLKPVDDPNVVYSFHMYFPHQFTHQGLSAEWPFGVVYPGPIKLQPNTEPVMVDRTWVEHMMKDAVDFQKRTKARIYVGEFSALRYTPEQSSSRYIKDLLDIFEANNWSWCYHAFREWYGWDAEMCNDEKCKIRHQSTDRLDLLKTYFAKGMKKP